MVADIAALDLRPGSLDAVVAFYSLTHVSRTEHTALLGRIARWLRPGGLLVASMGSGDLPGGVEEDFLGMGTPMFFSHFDAATNRRLVAEAGFRIRSAEVRAEQEDGRSVEFLWVIAERVAERSDGAEALQGAANGTGSTRPSISKATRRMKHGPQTPQWTFPSV